VVRSTHDNRAVAYRDGIAELVICRAVRRGQLRLLAPCCSALREYVRRSLKGARSDREAISTHHNRTGAYRDGIAEVVICRAVRGGQLRLLAPCRAVWYEHVRRSLIGVRADRVIRSPRHNRGAAGRDGIAELREGRVRMSAVSHLFFLADAAARSPAPIRAGHSHTTRSGRRGGIRRGWRLPAGRPAWLNAERCRSRRRGFGASSSNCGCGFRHLVW